ncbi:DNA-binding transcriptional regulator, FadR family [Bhargavaea ginsengi]|uniref:DNA-binding transcriptional regulator, FadR family n=1 Tax=Bhargavaea ginsengi TaxID=426757 RepID=A0A1H6UAB1_9BACL|nr:FadR/GntR family transcriptional regulator [Bhargavaea ginsengi]SEI88486.1 DNA-binding transcriptional regulator, FadR family [Bhargavaea ginsengi]
MRVKSRSEEVVNAIGKDIVNGVISPGERLPKVEELSEDYGVSRTVMREALQGLAARKIIRANQRSGTVVLPRNEWQLWDLSVMSWLSESEQRNEKFLLDLTEVRLGLEPDAAALAAKNATEEEKAKITACFERLEQTLDDPKAWAAADYDFHLSIIEATNNQLMAGLLKLLHKGLILSREKTVTSLNEHTELQQEQPTTEILNRHRNLYEAVISGDAEQAKSVMTDMILRVRQLIEATQEQQI